MLQVSQDAAHLLEASGKVGGAGIIRSEENGVQDFGGAGLVVQRGSDDAAVGACPDNLGRMYVHSLVAELAEKIDANVSLLRLVESQVGEAAKLILLGDTSSNSDSYEP